MLSTPALTLWAAIAAAAAMLLIVALDHRKPARRHAVTSRGRLIVRPAPAVLNVEQQPAVPYRGTSWYRRLGAFLGLGMSGLVLGAILGILLAAAAVGTFLLVDALLT